MKSLSMIASPLRVARVSLFLLASMLLLGGTAHAESTLTISHPEVAAPTVIDNGAPGESAGDVRLWHFNGAGR